MRHIAHELRGLYDDWLPVHTINDFLFALLVREV